MSVNSISPALLKRLNVSQGAQGTATLQNQAAPQVKQDKVEISTTPKKSLSKGAKIGIAFGAIATLASVAFLVFRGKAGAKEAVDAASITVKAADELVVEAGKIKTEAQSVVDNILARITRVDPGKGGKKVLTEFAEDGTTKIRESVLEDSALTIKDFVQKIVMEAKVETDDTGRMTGKLLEYSEGLEESVDGTVKLAKSINFDPKTGKLLAYAKDLEVSANGVIKSVKSIDFDPKTGKLLTYSEDFEGSVADGTAKASKYLNFDPKTGKPIRYREDLEGSVADGTAKANKCFNFDSKTGKWVEEATSDIPEA